MESKVEGASPALALNSTVRLGGLTSRPELNGKAGIIELFDTRKGRYAVRLPDGAGTMLFKPSNLEPVVDGAFVPGTSDACTTPEERRERIAALVRHAQTQHDLKQEAAAFVTTVTSAQSRAEVPDDVWDRVVEIQRIVQSSCNACDAGFPAALDEARAADDLPSWSLAAVEYAHYLLGQPEQPGADCRPIDKAKRLAGNAMKLHACGHRCRDALLAAAVCSAEGPFSRAAAAELQASAPDVCPLMDIEAWALRKEREAMHDELGRQWDMEKHERLARRGAEMAESLEAHGAGPNARPCP
jgi:hypothetical protein